MAAAAANGANANTFELLQKLEDFFSSPAFTTTLGSFLSEHVSQLEFPPLDQEQPLKNHDIYRQYTIMVEQQLEKFLATEGITAQEIYTSCQKAQSEGGANWLTCVDYLVASTEYEAFMELACDHASMLAWGDGDDAEEWIPAQEALI